MAGGAERRRFPRRDQRLLIKFRAIGGAHHRDVADRVGLIRNISKGGFELEIRRELPVDTLLELRIPDSALGPARTLQGRVQWSREESESGRVRAGCTFVKIVETKADRRQHPREPRKLRLEIRAGGADVIEGELRDLSKGGIEFEAPQPFKPHAKLDVHFPASPLGAARSVWVEVLRCTATERAGWHRSAGRFVATP